jgi:hypothetical protein
MRGLAFLAFCLVLVSCTRWTKRDSALELAFVTTTAIDWHQTMSITAGCLETNPMIGTCGDVVPPSVYFPIVIVLHAAVAAVLPRPWREIFQSFTIGVEANTIYTNRILEERQPSG